MSQTGGLEHNERRNSIPMGDRNTMELVALVGSDKENLGQITALLNRGDWDKTILLKNKDSEFPSGKSEIINIDSSKPLTELKDELIKKLKEKVKGFEVALSIASGTGKEHMALISALLSIPVGIRLVVYTKNGIEFIN